MVQGFCWSMPTFMPQSEEKGFDSRFMDYPETFYGQKAYGRMDRLSASQVAYLSSTATNPQDYIDFLDFISTPEAIRVANFGLEGVHYNYDSDGNMVFPEDAEDISWAVYYRNMFLPEDWYPVYGVNANWVEYYYPSERHSVGATDFDPVQFMSQNADDVSLEKELKESIIDIYAGKFVTGEMDLTEENFAQMVQEWKGAGGQQLMDSYTAQYQSMGSPDFSNMYRTYLPEDHPEYTGKYLWKGSEDLKSQPIIKENQNHQ